MGLPQHTKPIIETVMTPHGDNVTPGSTGTKVTPHHYTDSSIALRLPCSCSSYRNRGLPCPCSIQAAAHLTSRAVERILHESRFFPPGCEYEPYLNPKNIPPGTPISNHAYSHTSVVKSRQIIDLSEDHSAMLGNTSNHSISSLRSTGSRGSRSNLSHVVDVAALINRKIMQVDRDELKIGMTLGKGGFCNVRKATLQFIDLGKEYTRKSTRRQREQSESTTSVSFSDESMNPEDIPPPHPRKTSVRRQSDEKTQEYCIKFLKPAIVADRKKFSRGTADLAIEAHFLATLNHPHILKLRGVSKGFHLFHPEDYTEVLGKLPHHPDKQDGFFLLLDKLKETLDFKIYETWKLQQDRFKTFGFKVQDFRGTKKRAFRLDRLVIALQLAQAMQYLHQHDIVYRGRSYFLFLAVIIEVHIANTHCQDLKPDNVGVDSRGMVKLFDFGLAKELKDYRKANDGTYKLTSNTGSRRYMAPEVAKRERYNTLVDVFSFGILLWEICSLEKPFDGYSEQRHFNSVILGHHRPRMDVIKHEKWPVDVRETMVLCWSPKWQDRPTFRDVVSTLFQAYNSLIQECELDYKPPSL